MHLGCGSTYLDGYVNIDASLNAHTDLCADFRRIDKVFAADSLSEVLMIHSLGYLNLWEARDLFRLLYRLFESRGKLIIELPDVINCARKILESAESEADYLEGIRGFYAFGMDQIETRDKYTPYAFGWSAWHLKKELEDAGFREVMHLQPETHERTWRDMRIEACKP